MRTQSRRGSSCFHFNQKRAPDATSNATTLILRSAFNTFPLIISESVAERSQETKCIYSYLVWRSLARRPAGTGVLTWVTLALMAGVPLDSVKEPNRRLIRAVRMVPAVSGEFVIFGPRRARCEAWVGPKRS